MRAIGRCCSNVSRKEAGGNFENRILCDREIARVALAGMIRPFVPELVRESEQTARLSYGLSGYGYDLQGFGILFPFPPGVVGWSLTIQRMLCHYSISFLIGGHHTVCS